MWDGALGSGSGRERVEPGTVINIVAFETEP